MDKTTRRNMIQQSAQRARQSQPKPMRKPGRTEGRWIRTGSLTLTTYAATKETLARLIREAIEARAGEINEGEDVKVHCQLTEKRRQP